MGQFSIAVEVRAPRHFISTQSLPCVRLCPCASFPVRKRVYECHIICYPSSAERYAHVHRCSLQQRIGVYARIQGRELALASQGINLGKQTGGGAKHPCYVLDDNARTGAVEEARADH